MKRKSGSMRFRIRFVLILAPLALILTGCFQQAGTALENPISITNQAVNVPEASNPLPTQDAPTNSDTGAIDNGQGEVLNTPTFVVLPTDDLSGGNTDSGNPPVALTIISATLPPAATDTPSAPSETGSQTVDTQGNAGQGQFITPSGPLGPITQVPISVTTESGEPTATPSGLVTPTAFSAPESADTCTHTVQPGDTLYRIGLKYGVTVGQLREANPNIGGDIIQPGDILRIPGCTAGSSTGSDTSTVKPTSTIASFATALPSNTQTYVVQRGDTLYTIALKFGVTIDAIQKANNISNPNRINPGQELIIPAKSG